MSVKVGALLLIEWMDSASAAGGGTWKDAEELKELAPVRLRSVGWVLREDKESVVLVGHIAESQCSGDLCIPKKAIVKRRVLER